MIKATSIVTALAVATSIASAQPGSTPPTDPSAPPPPPIHTGATVEAGPYSVNVDDVIARVAAEAPSMQRVAYRAFDRARRAIAVGPTVGYWAASEPAQSDYDHAITFGLGFEWFDVPVLPDAADLGEMLLDHVKARVKDQLQARLAGQQLDRGTVEQIARELFEQVRGELVRVDNTRGQRIERSNFNVAFEVNRTFHADDWITRLRAGIGVWKLTLGASVATAFRDKVAVYAGPELVLHVQTLLTPRSPVIDVFVRGDFEVRDRDHNTDMLVFGARFLLDAI